MPDFNGHVNQAKANLDFLEQINQHQNKRWDWQVTAVFYVAVHLINAHIVNKTGNHYNTHAKADIAINPENATSISKLPELEYLAYSKLQSLSRRSRYLYEHKETENTSMLTHDKHFSKAVRHLNVLIKYMVSEYGIDIPTIKLKCMELKKQELDHFEIV